MNPGTKDVKLINDSISKIEGLTNWYRKKRITTEKYIEEMHEALSGLTNERDYYEYLISIGQMKKLQTNE